MNIAMHTAKTSGKTIVVFSLEMSREQLALRLLSSESFIDSKKLQTGKIKQDEWRRLTEAASSISSADLLINDDSYITVADMNAQCLRLPNLGLVVIDFIQLMESASGTRGNQGESREQIVSEISRKLKIMAKELNVPVLCLSQLSRANEKRPDKRPMLSDLRESGGIEQNADVVLGLYRDYIYNKEAEFQNVTECLILKNRRGEIGTIELQWMPEYMTFSTLERRHEE